MRVLIKTLLVFAVLSTLALTGGAWFALADQPLIDAAPPLAHQDIARARRILEQNRPRLVPGAGALQAAEFSQTDLNLICNYLVQKFARGGVALRLADQRLHLAGSLTLAWPHWRRYLNIDAELRSVGGRLEFERLRIGDLQLPAPLATALTYRLIRHLARRHLAASQTLPIRDIQLTGEHLHMRYAWNGEVENQIRRPLVQANDRAAMRYYHDRIVELLDTGQIRARAVSHLMQALFSDAQQRSQTADPVIENTALLTVLGTWAADQDLTRLVPNAERRPPGFNLKLQGRIDFARHFLASAALAARGDQALSHAVGIFKEIADTDHGSGFSFTDLAADRAGTRFGELATRSPVRARRLQDNMAAGISDGDIMPPAHDLPENLRAADFEARVGYVGSAAYQRLIDDIEQRIDACRLYR